METNELSPQELADRILADPNTQEAILDGVVRIEMMRSLFIRHREIEQLIITQGNLWSVTASGCHIHSGTSATETTQARPQYFPLSANGATLNEAIAQLLVLSDRHDICPGSTCGKACPHHAEH